MIRMLENAVRQFAKRSGFLHIGQDNESTRERWIQRNLSALPQGWRLLDAGAGEQRHRHLCAHLKYVAQDFGKYDGIGDDRGLQTRQWNQAGLDIVSDITSVPEPDGSFDAVLCTEVLEHLPKPMEALKELVRLLRQGGHLILTAPFISMTHMAPYHYCTGFNRYFYDRALPELGLEVIELSYNGNFFEFVAQELRRVPSMAERYSATQMLHLHEAAAIAIVLGMLRRLSRKDRGSSELCSFGLHVRAIKK